MRSVKVSPKYQVVVPKEIRHRLHLKPGQRLVVMETGGVILMVPEVPLEVLRGLLPPMDLKDLRDHGERFE